MRTLKDLGQPVRFCILASVLVGAIVPAQSAVPASDTAFHIVIDPSAGAVNRFRDARPSDQSNRITCPIRGTSEIVAYYLTDKSPCDRLEKSGLSVRLCERVSISSAKEDAMRCSVTVVGRDQSLSPNQPLVSYILIGPRDENVAAERKRDVSYQDSLLRDVLQTTGYPIWEYYRVNNVVCVSVSPGNDVAGFLRRLGYRLPIEYKSKLASGSCAAQIRKLTGVNPPVTTIR